MSVCNLKPFGGGGWGLKQEKNQFKVSLAL